MGSILTAKCGNCGYNSCDLYYGGGMTNFDIYCGYPVVNYDKDEIEMENIFEKEKILIDNNKLLFYDSGSLINKEAIVEGNIHQWGDEYIHCGKVYFCPKCKEYKLEFIAMGYWD